MNVDNIIYCNDLEALKVQLKTDGKYDEETGTYTSDCSITPIKYAGNTTLSYTRGFSLDLSVYTMLENLGTYDEIWADADKDAKYKSVYPYDVPVEYIDEDGVTQSHMLPKKIGNFL